MTTVLQLLYVIAAQTVVYFIPPWITVQHFAPRESWAARLYWSAMLAISSQTLLGFAWGQFVRHSPATEAIIWVAGWLIISSVLSLRKVEAPLLPFHRLTSSSTFILLAIIAGALLTRCLHPLQTAALGQSDAYSHLQFIRAILNEAYLPNQMYPPGHAWSMSLPALIFKIDPYLISRFGGAITGLLLMMGAYLFTLQLSRSQSAALATAFFIAFFPPFNLLSKTSVGVFTSQLGLCYIPAVLILFTHWALSNFQINRQAILLSIAMAAMIITAPLMLIHLLMIMALTSIIISLFCISPCHHGRPCSPWRILQRATLMIIPALLLISLHLVQAEKISPSSLIITRHELSPHKPTISKQSQTAPIQNQRDIPAPPSSLQFISDFVKVKRTGYNDKLMDAATSAIGIACAVLLVIGWRRRSAEILALGAWGTLTSLQALTGVFQFSRFQREGWSLMIASTVLGGCAFGLAWPRVSHRPATKWIIAALMILSLAATCSRPPRHTFFVSSAESDIVDVIRGIVANARSMEGKRPIIATRKMAGFQKSTQGELVFAITEPLPALALDASQAIGAQLSPTNAYLILLERSASTNQTPAENMIMTRINPTMANDYSKVLKREINDIRAIESFLNTEAPAAWVISRQPATTNLWLITMTPNSP